MSRPKEHGAAEPDAIGTEGTATNENEQAEAYSPLDPEVEAPINAAVHFEDQHETTEGG